MSRDKTGASSCGIPTSSLPAAALPVRPQPRCWRATASASSLVDPHHVYPPDLRCEKLDGPQVSILRRTGLADAVLRAGTFDGECWIARFGRLIEKRAGDQYGILYDTLVNTIRAEIPASAEFINAKVTAIANSPDRQMVTLSTGEQISARLVVVANGLNIGLRHALGMTREDVSPCHSITIAFDLKPVGRSHFDFPALTYYPERAADRMAYITLFPIGSRDARELHGLSRHERSVAERDAAPSGRDAVRADAGSAQAHRRGGGGRARSRSGRPISTSRTAMCSRASCWSATRSAPRARPPAPAPARCSPTSSGCATSTSRSGSRPMGWAPTRSRAFYADPVKDACDRHSFDKAFSLRSMSIDQGLSWRARRWVRFLGRLAIGTVRRLTAPLRRTYPAA